MTCDIVAGIGVAEATPGPVPLPVGIFGLHKDCVKAEPDRPPKTL